MDEKIVGVFPIDIRGAWLCCFYDMYFTNKRIVAHFVGRGLYSRATSKFLIPIVMGGLLDLLVIRPLMKNDQVGPFSDAEQILKADRRNFTWNYQTDIRSIELKAHLTGFSPPGMVIVLKQGKEEKCFIRKRDFNDIRSLLQELADDKLITQKNRG